MANLKRIVKASRNASKNKIKKQEHQNKKSLDSFQSSFESSDSIDYNDNEPEIVEKRDINSDILFMTTDEKVKYFLQNGHKLKEKFDAKSPIKRRHSKEMKIRKPETKFSAGCDLPSPMKTKTGRLKSSKYKYLNIMDNILKTEFGMIPGNQHEKSLNTKSTRNCVNNNNTGEIFYLNNNIINSNDIIKVNDQVTKSDINQIDITKDKKNKTLDKSNPLRNQNDGTSVAPVNDLSSPKCIELESVKVQGKRNCSKKQTTSLKITAQPKKSQSHKKGKSKKNLNGVVTLTNRKRSSYINGAKKRMRIFECDYCSKIFTRKHSLVRHIYLHMGTKPHSCPICPKKFRVLKNLKNHVDRDHNVHSVDDDAETYSCNECDKPFLTKESLTLHLTSHTKGENSFKCIYCDKKFTYQLLLVQHEKKHLVTGKYQCTFCDMKYNSRDKLYVHVKGHLKLTDYICQYCGREFLRANSMKRHIQIMHGGHTVQCPICNKKLKGHLSEHLRTHDKERPHKCPDCGKHFAQSTQMQVHRRGHTGYHPYTCRICERPFSHSNALILHLRRHTGEKPYPCAECPMSFSQIPHMKAHMSNIHGKQKPYKCLKCDDYFKLQKDLVIHKKSCTGTGIDTDLYGDKKMYEDHSRDSTEHVPVESTMTLSRMRFLLALLLTMIASKAKLKYLGFNKRLVDDLLVESLEAMDQIPCRDETISPLLRLRTNIETLLNGTVPEEQMEKFRKENKSTEELLELLTSEKEKRFILQPIFELLAM